ncbi:DUF1834 family protein [Sphingomonas canadensis]|uniref:DUF1834 family protein n=1 Tax=Sphingomonas canadensis TaxID=1219257 RepID=A0ABW3HA04_9SPHN|nr:DUF1834 family protein [Sphingomonas canadensis]MCW3835972.1 DUF1834 family protein [Sphingomonas canadensis]
MIAAIELAILARLKALSDAGTLPWRWRTLATYPEDFDALLESQAEIRTPAAWVTFAGWDSSYLTGDGAMIVEGAQFGVMIADENRRPSEQHQRHGGPDPASEPGSYRLLAAAASALANQTLGLDLVKPLLPGAVRLVRPTEAIQRRKLSMYAIQLSCDFAMAVAEDGETDPAALETLHVNWDVPVFADPAPVDREPGAPGTQLPDDFHADATDTIALNQEED